MATSLAKGEFFPLRYRRTLLHSVQLLFLLVGKELKVRYKSSFLGYIWALANPFAFALVYYVAFKLIMRVQMPNYSIFLLTGMFPWIWASNSLIQATGSYRNNPSLVKRVNMHRAILPLSNVVHEMVHFCFSVPVLLVFIIATGGELHVSLLWQFPLMVLIQLIAVYPLALLFAIANVFVHDVEYLVGLAISMLFFLTPVVYPVSMIPEPYRQYFVLNPLVPLIESWRGVFLEGRLDFGGVLWTVTFGLTVSLLALWCYRRFSFRLGELL